MLNKTELRRQCRRARLALPRQIRQAAELATARQLKQLIKRGQKIALYHPIGSEMRLDHFVRSARQRGARLYLPYIVPRQRRMWFTPYLANAQAEPKRGAGSLNIPQFAGRKIRAHQLNIVIVPMVGIDGRGYRLGQGGGYYDATFALKHHGLQARRVAVGFACQLLPEVPHEPHDCQMNDFVCENNWLRFKPMSL